MTFEQIKKFAEQYTYKAKNHILNPFILCDQLNIALKTKSQYIAENNGITPLDKNPAILIKIGTTKQPKNTIYFDENSEFWKFYVFHEIAHCILQHDTDEIKEEKEANMLSCCLIAPVEILPTYLKNANDLSLFAHIPIARAEEYWEEIKDHFLIKNNNNKFIILCIAIPIILFFTTIGIGFHKNNNKDLHDNNAIIVQAQKNSSIDYLENAENTISETVYVTPTGKKYHKKDCYHIQDCDIKELSLAEAQKKYTPCKTCFQ